MSNERQPTADTIASGPFHKDEFAPRLFRIIRESVASLSRKYTSVLYDPHDFVQETWIRVASDDYKVLRQYDASKHLSLDAYIRMITEREICTIIRKERAKKRGRHVTVGISDHEAGLPCHIRYDAKLEARNLANRLYTWLCSRLSDLGVAVLTASFCYGDDVSDTATNLGISSHAVYCWQYKIRALSREFIYSEVDRKSQDF